MIKKSDDALEIIIYSERKQIYLRDFNTLSMKAKIP